MTSMCGHYTQRTLQNAYLELCSWFLAKIVTVKSFELFAPKCFITDVGQGSICASTCVSVLKPYGFAKAQNNKAINFSLSIYFSPFSIKRMLALREKDRVLIKQPSFLIPIFSYILFKFNVKYMRLKFRIIFCRLCIHCCNRRFSCSVISCFSSLYTVI